MKYLKNIRIARKITQKTLASYLNVSASTICDWEREKSSPSPMMLVKIADFFDVTVDELLGRTVGPRFFDDACIDSLEIIDIYKQLPPAQQNILLSYGRGMLAANKAH